MSKHALVAYSNTLRQEMVKWGVHVAVIEPSGFRTGKYFIIDLYSFLIMEHIFPERLLCDFYFCKYLFFLLITFMCLR